MEDTAALGRYLRAMIKWWWLILTSVVIAVLASYVTVSGQPRVYQAVTTLMVGQVLRKENPTYQDLSISTQLAQTYANMVARRPILEGAAEALGLSFVPYPGNVSAYLVPGTQLIEIRVRDASATRAQALANEIAHQLILQSPTESTENRGRQDFVEAQLRKLEENIESTEQQIQEEQAKLDEATSARTIEQYRSNISALETRLSSYQDTYASMLQTIEEGINYVTVVEPASTPSQPISPNTSNTLLMAAAIGFGLSAGGAFLLEFLDNTIRTPEELSGIIGLSPLGMIERTDIQDPAEQLVTLVQPESSISEAFRALRVNLRFAAVDKSLTKLVVTSATATEGKSFVSSNLAVTMALSGYSVILVDADLRRPSQHKIFDLSNTEGLSSLIMNSNGLETNYGRTIDLEGTSDLFSEARPSKVIPAGQKTRLSGLRVITSGPVPPNPADLLSSSHMEALSNQFRDQADIVIFDTPPVLSAIDAIALATQADGTVLVSEFGRTRYAAAKEAVERLRRVDAHLLGFILNRILPKSERYYTYTGRDETSSWSPLLFSWDAIKAKLSKIGFLRKVLGGHNKRNTA